MDEKVTRWQQDARAAFDWIAGMYEQAQVLWDDMEARFRDDGWELQKSSGWPSVAMSMYDTSNWPFIYLKAAGALPKQVAEGEDTGRAAVFGILFYDGQRQGPVCFGGVFSWSDYNATTDHWMLYGALGGADSRILEGTFERTAAGPIFTATPTAKGRKSYPGVESVRWFEVPLGAISSSERLREAVRATEAMYEGDDARAINLVRSLE